MVEEACFSKSIKFTLTVGYKIQFLWRSKRVEICNDVGSVLRVVESGEWHFISREILWGSEEVHENMLIWPDDSWVLQGFAWRIRGGTGCSADDSSENWCCGILSIAFESVTDWAVLFEDGFSSLDITFRDCDIWFFDLLLLFSTTHVLNMTILFLLNF